MQFFWGLVAGIVVGLVMEWVIDWAGLMPRRSRQATLRPHSRNGADANGGAAVRPQPPEDAAPRPPMGKE